MRSRFLVACGRILIDHVVGHSSVVRKVSVGFCVAIAFLIVIAGFAYHNASSYVAASRRVAHTYEVLGKVSEIVSHLNEAESQQRAYLITGDAQYLQWRDRLFLNIRQNILSLAAMTADNPVQQSRITELEQKIKIRLDAMEITRGLRETRGLEAVQRRILSGVGPTAMDGVRSVTSAMETEENGLLQLRNAEVKENADLLLEISVAVVVVISSFLAWLLIVIRRQIVEQKRTEQAIEHLNVDLQHQTVQLKVANKELEGFSYTVSHDLRAPLRAIDGYALMLEEDYRDRLDQEATRYISVIRTNSKRMGNLIDDLLAFSRLGRKDITKTDLNMNALVQEVIAEALSQQSENKPTIDVGSLPPADADRVLLRQVWLNLISNALKFSAKSTNPVIEVSGRKNGLENIYSVRDNGVGFSMEYVDKLFGVFQRLHRVDDFGGTGVGLAIVQRLVTRHGGRVWAEGAVNEGATFSFALPVGEQHE